MLGALDQQISTQPCEGWSPRSPTWGDNHDYTMEAQWGLVIQALGLSGDNAPCVFSHITAGSIWHRPHLRWVVGPLLGSVPCPSVLGWFYSVLFSVINHNHEYDISQRVLGLIIKTESGPGVRSEGSLVDCPLTSKTPKFTGLGPSSLPRPWHAGWDTAPSC